MEMLLVVVKVLIVMVMVVRNKDRPQDGVGWQVQGGGCDTKTGEGIVSG